MADEPRSADDSDTSPHRSKWGFARIVAIIAGLFFGTAVLGAVFGIIKSFSAIGGESIDPSQKARILAEGISEAMNCAAFAMLVMLVSGVVVLGYWLVKGKNDPVARITKVAGLVVLGVGMLGTISGVVQTYMATQAPGFSPLDKQRILSNGIAETAYNFGFAVVLSAPLFAVSWWAKKRSKK